MLSCFSSLSLGSFLILAAWFNCHWSVTLRLSCHISMDSCRLVPATSAVDPLSVLFPFSDFVQCQLVSVSLVSCSLLAVRYRYLPVTFDLSVVLEFLQQSFVQVSACHQFSPRFRPSLVRHVLSVKSSVRQVTTSLGPRFPAFKSQFRRFLFRHCH